MPLARSCHRRLCQGLCKLRLLSMLIRIRREVRGCHSLLRGAVATATTARQLRLLECHHGLWETHALLGTIANTVTEATAVWLRPWLLIITKENAMKQQLLRRIVTKHVNKRYRNHKSYQRLCGCYSSCEDKLLLKSLPRFVATKVSNKGCCCRGYSGRRRSELLPLFLIRTLAASVVRTVVALCSV